jgi:teichuronic acid biosynthesis glycosyltransferase TuaC
MTPLRVLVLTNMWPTRERPAFGSFVRSQVESLSEAGAAATVWFVDGRTSRFAYVRAAARALALNLTRDRFDVVHAHTGHCGAVALLQRRYPTVISFVGYDLYGKHTVKGTVTWKSRFESRLFRHLGRGAAATITKSAELEQLLPEDLRARNSVIPNGVDRSVFAPQRREDARRGLGWPVDEVTVLFAGDPGVPRKRFDLAVRACQIAREAIPELRLRTCCDIPHEAVATWMSAADALLLPSIAEGSPNVVKEAAACGLPVVAAAVGDVPEVLDNVAPSAVVSRDADAAAYADALVSVLEVRRRSNGRERTSWLAADATAIRLVSLYERVSVGGGRALQTKLTSTGAP